MSLLARSALHYDVEEDVEAELARQVEKWGMQDHDPLYWLAILGEEYGEACQALLEADKPDRRNDPAVHADARAELIQVAAVAITMIENMDRRAAGG